MAGPIRNACVARGQASLTRQGTVFHVPPNTVLLLKSIGLHTIAAPPNTATVQISSADGSAKINVVAYDFTGPAAVVRDVWIALNAGDFIDIYVSAGNVWYWLSGALLPYVPGQGGAQELLSEPY